MSNVFIAFQANEDARPIVEAIIADNPHAVLVESPGLIKIDAPNELTIRRETVEEKLGRAFSLQEVQINLVTLSGYLDEDDDQMTLSWNH
ncbi:MmoB/DmpM family protein [Ampullimonas aquatilis]|uniref:MmoB/DmpM family protein n=1 Tax=Ampullimonas aquatilis TaxID=1341549 RepID=UPI003C76C6D4